MTSTQQPAALRDSLLHSTTIVGGMTFLSRVSGLARDMVISRGFGAGIETDAFFVAFKIPNMLRRFFSEGAFAQAFVPVISEYRATRSRAEAKELIDRTAGSLALVLVVITAIGVVAAPLLILIFAPGPGFSEDGRAVLATDMLRFTFPYILFISLTALAGAVLNTYRRFAIPAFTPVLLNLVLIVFATAVAPLLERPALALAFGVFVAGAVQLAFQVPFLWKVKLLPRPRLGFAHPGVKRIQKLMAPILFGSSVAQLNLLIDMMIASFLVAGSYSWLYYSDRLVGFPLGVFGIALATAILPSLSEQHARLSTEAFQRHDRLGAPARAADRRARGRRLDAPRPTVDNDDFLRRRVHRPGHRHGYCQPAGVRARSHRIHSSQGTRTGILLPPGHPYAGSHRDPGAGPEYGAQHRIRARVAHNPMGPGARGTRGRNEHFGPLQTRRACCRGCAGTASTGRRQAGRRCFSP